MTVIAPAGRTLSLAPPRAGHREWVGLAVLSLPTLLVAIDNTVLGFALPAISAALAPSATQLLWLVDIYPLVLAALLGGRGTVWGPVLGAFIVQPLAEFTNTTLGGPNAGALRLIFFGALLGAVVLFLPSGVLPTLAPWFRRAALRSSREGR